MWKFLVAPLVVGTLSIPSIVLAQPADRGCSAETLSIATLHQNMRALWSDHVVWTRQYIVAAV